MIILGITVYMTVMIFFSFLSVASLIDLLVSPADEDTELFGIPIELYILFITSLLWAVYLNYLI